MAFRGAGAVVAVPRALQQPAVGTVLATPAWAAGLGWAEGRDVGREQGCGQRAGSSENWGKAGKGWNSRLAIAHISAHQGHMRCCYPSQPYL